MVDTCTISRGDAGPPVYDPQTQTYSPPPGAQRYTGRCRVRPRPTEDRVVQAGEEPVSTRSYIVSVPMSVVEVAVDDVVTITASQLDPDLADTRMRVLDVGKGSQLTARRLVCEEVLG